MANDQQQQPTMGNPGEGRPDVNVARESALAREVGMPLRSDQQAPVTKLPDNGLTLDQSGGPDATLRRANEDLGGDAKPGADGGDQQEKPEGQTTDVALPEYDPQKPEVVEAYTKQFTVDGNGQTLNMEALSANWFKNAKPGADGTPQGSLDEGAYAYLEEHHGLSKADVKRFEAGQVALQQQAVAAVHARAGGADKYAAALEWAKKGGYDDTSKARFNAALDKGGQEQADAIDLLMQRFNKANPPPRRRVPDVSAGSAGNPSGGSNAGGGVQGFESYAEYQSELRKARAEGDQKKLDEVRRRFQASPWRGK